MRGLIAKFGGWLGRLWGADGRTARADVALGARGEALAAKHLERAGYRILERNARVPMGEADLVALAPDGVHVLVEVKTRARGKNARSDRAAPELAITSHKRRKLRTIARHLARANQWTQVRVDVIAVEWPRGGGEPVLRHYAGVRV